MPSENLALAERLEAATGPSRELDQEIAFAINLPSHDEWGCEHGWAEWYSDGSRRWGDNFKHPGVYFSSSLDAAMTLVPEGCENDWSLVGGASWQAEVVDSLADAATPALALAAASLRARAAS